MKNHTLLRWDQWLFWITAKWNHSWKHSHEHILYSFLCVLASEILDSPIIQKNQSSSQGWQRGYTFHGFQLYIDYNMDILSSWFYIDVMVINLWPFVFCGLCRSLVWLQSQRDVSVERRGGLRRDDPHEYRVGRLKHERVTVPRGPDLLLWAQQVWHILTVHTFKHTVHPFRWLVQLTPKDCNSWSVSSHPSCNSRLFYQLCCTVHKFWSCIILELEIPYQKVKSVLF